MGHIGIVSLVSSTSPPHTWTDVPKRGHDVLGGCTIGGFVRGRSERSAAQLLGCRVAVRAAASGAGRTVRDGSSPLIRVLLDRVRKTRPKPDTDFFPRRSRRGRGRLSRKARHACPRRLSDNRHIPARDLSAAALG